MTTTALNTKNIKVKNKIWVVSDLVKKTYYDAKISDTETKYFTKSDYSKIYKNKRTWCKDKKRITQ